MSEPWRNGTDDEVEVDLSEFAVVIDRVRDLDAIGGAGIGDGMANVTFLCGASVTIHDWSPRQLRTLAAAFIAFADVLDGDPAEPA